MTGSLSCRRRARARDKVAEAAYDSRVDTERGAIRLWATSRHWNSNDSMHSPWTVSGLWTPFRCPRVRWIPRCAWAPHRPQGAISVNRSRREPESVNLSTKMGQPQAVALGPLPFWFLVPWRVKPASPPSPHNLP